MIKRAKEQKIKDLSTLFWYSFLGKIICK